MPAAEVQPAAEEGLAALVEGEVRGAVAEVEQHVGGRLRVAGLDDRVGECQRGGVEDVRLDAEQAQRGHVALGVLVGHRGQQDVELPLGRVAAQDLIVENHALRVEGQVLARLESQGRAHLGLVQQRQRDLLDDDVGPADAQRDPAERAR